ncbi:MAG: S-layer homology domain-containing protein [Clostridia bacterium]|nr:S-layer homology domain-containing protein [Clostridia bacterium]
MRSKIFRIVSGIMVLFLVLPLLPTAKAQNNWNMEYFYKTYSDPHFNLNNEPNRVMTIEEFIAITHAYSYYGSGSASVTVRDKNGRTPSAWCAKYVQAEADKKVFDTEKISWSDPVTIAFAAQFMARSKGKYSYDSNNIYNFSGTAGMAADDVLYLSVAVDHGLIEYKSRMNVSSHIMRKDARKYEIPKTVSIKPIIKGAKNSMRDCNVYFIDCYWDLDAANNQLSKLKKNSAHITSVTFQSGYLNGTNVTSGNTYLGCDIEHTEALEYNNKYTTDPQVEAIKYCKDNKITALLGISNIYNNSFTGNALETILSSKTNMQNASREILAAVRKYNLDGVNLGIEVTNPALSHLRGAYSTFVKQVGDLLHAQGYVLTVSVGAYFTDKQERASIYDYTEIGRVADKVHVILYDDFNDTGFTTRNTHGPMSNLTRIGRCIRYASAKMASSKILLGVGAYAIDFNLTWWKAEDIDYGTATSLMRKYGATTVYDNTNGAAGAYFEYTDGASCKHRVYLETASTIAQRTEVVNNYNLGGYSVFNLQDDNGTMFSAITAASAFKPEVISAMRSGISPLNLRGDYSRAIQRYEFCEMIVDFIEGKNGKTIDQFLKSKGVKIDKSVFNDVYDADYVYQVNALGIVGGYGDGKFKPYNSITRQEAATMLMRLAKVMGMEKPNSVAITFVESASLQSWAKEGIDFISACVDKKTGKNVMGGTGNNKFSPLGTYTREQTYMSMVRLFNAF